MSGLIQRGDQRGVRSDAAGDPSGRFGRRSGGAVVGQSQEDLHSLWDPVVPELRYGEDGDTELWCQEGPVVPVQKARLDP